jgi:hypothetical protein
MPFPGFNRQDFPIVDAVGRNELVDTAYLISCELLGVRRSTTPQHK